MFYRLDAIEDLMVEIYRQGKGVGGGQSVRKRDSSTRTPEIASKIVFLMMSLPMQ